MEIPEEFLDKTIKLFQPYSKEPLTREDAREIVQNFVGFFEVLMEWDREGQKKGSKYEVIELNRRH